MFELAANFQAFGLWIRRDWLNVGLWDTQMLCCMLGTLWLPSVGKAKQQPSPLLNRTPHSTNFTKICSWPLAILTHHLLQCCGCSKEIWPNINLLAWWHWSCLLRITRFDCACDLWFKSRCWRHFEQRFESQIAWFWSRHLNLISQWFGETSCDLGSAISKHQRFVTCDLEHDAIQTKTMQRGPKKLPYLKTKQRFRRHCRHHAGSARHHLLGSLCISLLSLSLPLTYSSVLSQGVFKPAKNCLEYSRKRTHCRMTHCFWPKHCGSQHNPITEKSENYCPWLFLGGPMLETRKLTSLLIGCVVCE